MTNRDNDGYREICTIGTSTRILKDFLLLLREVGVAVVVDVRRFPISRLEHFRGKKLEQELKSIGIRYVYLGGELGGYRKGGYEAYVATEEFRLGVEVVERDSREGQDGYLVRRAAAVEVPPQVHSCGAAETRLASDSHHRRRAQLGPQERVMPFFVGCLHVKV